MGTDGGWWLPLLAQRQTNLPPLTYSAEAGPWPEYKAWINALPEMLARLGPDDPGVLAELQARGLTYAYLGDLQGRVNNPGKPLLDPIVLSKSPHYRPVYQEDRVWIFEIMP